MTTSEPEPYSREWFVARIGETEVAAGERLAKEAPEPSPEVIEKLRWIFGPTIQRLRIEAAQARHTLAA